MEGQQLDKKRLNIQYVKCRYGLKYWIQRCNLAARLVRWSACVRCCQPFPGLHEHSFICGAAPRPWTALMETVMADKVIINNHICFGGAKSHLFALARTQARARAHTLLLGLHGHVIARLRCVAKAHQCVRLCGARTSCDRDQGDESEFRKRNHSRPTPSQKKNEQWGGGS